MDIKILENLLEVTIDRGNLRTRHHQVIQKRIMIDLGLLKSGSGAAEHDRSGKPELTSWNTLQKVDLHREEPLRGGNAHSARYGELIHDGTGKLVSVHTMKQSSVSNAQKSTSSRILCCASERFFNIPIPTKLGRTELQEPDPRKATETMMLSMDSRLNSSGTFSQDSQRCSSVIKSMIC